MKDPRFLPIELHEPVEEDDDFQMPDADEFKDKTFVRKFDLYVAG